MKELRRNMRLVGTLILVCFIAASGWYGMTVYTQGSVWASDVYNRRLSASHSMRGEITDRNGVVLAHTDADGRRIYLESEMARRALSQTVGDVAGMSGTGVETYYSSTLLDLSSSLSDRLSEIFNDVDHVGSGVQVTVDAKLQAYVSSIFPQGYKGAVCILNYKTGEIMAMVSLPDYDPNELLSRSDIAVEDSAYLNRCLQGLYTPGSIFKIVTLASALDYDANVVSQEFTCSGTWEYEGGSIVCMSGRTAHGDIDLKNAFTKSCNVTFGKLAYQLGNKRLAETAQRFGFNENFKFEDFVVYNSSYPEDVSLMNGLVWAGIGQGEVLVTPLHVAMISGAVANDGVMMQPYLTQRIETALGQVTHTGEAKPYRTVMSVRTANIIEEYMYSTVVSGTGTKAAIDGMMVCGKTGSAETSNDKSKATDAWYTGYVNDPRHPYAVAVVIEQGGYGGDLAASLASKALEKAVELAK